MRDQALPLLPLSPLALPPPRPCHPLLVVLSVDTYNSSFWIGLDQLCCKLTAWNYRYHRVNFFQKLAPSYAFLVLRKPERR